MEVCNETPRRSAADSSSSSCPDFEFWMVRNPAFPPPLLLTADELFADGVLLPLRFLPIPRTNSDPAPEPAPAPAPQPDPPPPPEPESPSMASLSSCLAPASASKRWKGIFKAGEKKPEEKDKQRTPKERKSGAAAELNLKIWPFSRSRSAGTGGRPLKAAVAARRASSAPCSRSNSRGESSRSGRRCAASPARSGLGGGVHVGRTGPVWQLRRKTKGGGGGGGGEGGGGKPGGGIKGISLNVNTCIGYGSEMSCGGEDKDVLVGGERSGGGDGGGSLFNLRTLFSKKVY